MPYNPAIHRRRTIRLKGYDYSQAGMYFVTICCQDRICRFGKIENGEMAVNEYGKIAYNEWVKLSERYPNVLLDIFQIMPNRIHGIIALNETANVGATLAVAQNNNANNVVGAGLAPALVDNRMTDNRAGMNNRATARVAPTDANDTIAQNKNANNTNVRNTVGNIVGAYKSLVTNQCLEIYKSQNQYMGKLWQRNYYEHIIRNDNSYQHIAGYIINNPADWEKDKFYAE